MRVLVLTADYGQTVWSGIGTAVFYQAEALAGRGHEVCVATETSPSFRKPDVIHVHSLSLVFTALRLGKTFGAPVVYTAHSLIATELMGQSNVGQWIALQRTALESADCVCFVSRLELERTLRSMPGLALKSVVVPNGVPEPSPVPSGCFSGPLVFAGRFVRNKGADIVARMAPMILESELTRELIFAGGHGDPPETEMIQRVAARYSKRCRVAGWLTRDKLHELLATASMLLAPSRYEPFGMVAAEAMRLGVPVLACATGGLAEMMLPESGGTLIQSLNPEKWVATCRALLHNENAWSVLNRRGPRYISANFSIAKTAAQLESVLAGTVTKVEARRCS